MFGSVKLYIYDLVQSKIFSVATCNLVQSNKIILFYLDLIWSKGIRPIMVSVWSQLWFWPRCCGCYDPQNMSFQTILYLKIYYKQINIILC